MNEMAKSDKVNHFHSLLQGSLFVLFGLFISKILTYVYRLIIAREGPADYGIISLGITVISIISLIAMLGLNDAVGRFVPYYLGKKKLSNLKGAIIASLTISFAVSLLFSAAVYLLSGVISLSVFHEPRLILVLQILSFSIPFLVLNTVLVAAFTGFQRMDLVSFTKYLSENIIRVLITFALISLGFGLVGISFAYVLSIVATLLLSFYLLEKRVFSLLDSKIKPKVETKVLLTYSIPLLFSGLLWMIVTWTDTLFIGYFLNVSQVGIYNAVIPTVSLILVIPTVLLSLFGPVITLLYSKNQRKELSGVYKRITKWVFFTTFPVALGMIVFSKQLLNALFGSDYAVGYLSLIVLVAGYFVYSMLLSCEGILRAFNKPKLVLSATFFSAFLNVLLNYFLIPIYGILGGAISTGLSLCFYSILVLLLSYKSSGAHPFSKVLLKELIAGLVSIALVFVARQFINFQQVLVNFCLALVLFVVSYFSLLLLLRVFDEEDVVVLKKLLKKFGLGFITGFID